MGKEKRLFLLAVMTVLISTAGYGTIYSKNENIEIGENRLTEINKEKNATFISVSENGSVIIKDKKENDENLEITKKEYREIKNEKGEILANRVLNINTNSTSENINNGILSGEFNLANGVSVGEKTVFDVVGVQKGIFINKGIIKIAGSQDFINSQNKKQTIQAKGINITNENGKANNKGLIESSNGAIGVNITKGYFTNEDKAEIKTSGKGSIGIKIEVSADNVSEISNKGIINVENGATGILFTNNKGILDNKNGIINVSGESSIGMQANKNATGSNNGTIIVNAQKFTVGMKSTGASSSIENKGNLTIIGDNVNTSNGMVAQQGGKVINSGKLENETGLFASGKTTNAMNASGAKKKQIADENGKLQYVVEKYMKTTAENNGDITVSNGATAMKIEDQAIGKNTGNINVSSGSKSVVVSESVFINSGTINVVENNGIAIQNIGSKEEFVDKNGVAVKEKRILNNTVYLKNGSKIKGIILGAEGVDVLTLGKGNHEGLNVGKYEAFNTRGGGEINISNSTIALEYNEGTNEYLENSKKKLDNADGNTNEKGNLSLNNSNLIIDIKKQEVDGKNDNLGTMIDADKVSFNNVKFGFKSNKENEVFNITKILEDATNNKNGDKFDKTSLDYLGSSNTAIWTYSKDGDDWYATKKTFGEAAKSQVSEFAQFLDNGKLDSYTDELQFLSQGEFDKGIAQLSGGLHGYTVDIAAVNSRTLSNTMRERALTRDYLIKRPVSSWTQDISYIDNNHRFGGLMDVKYNEKGVIGISEKQILSTGKLGLVYGGSSGKADAEDNGNIDIDTAYFGGYYNHEFNDKWSLNSNANFVYTHNRVTRNVKFGEKENEVKENNFKANYPTYTVGMGSSLIYTLKDDLYNRAHFYAGIDVNRIMQGMITEDEDKKFDGAKELAVRKNGAANDKSYYSIVPNAGFMVQNTGYIFDKKYRIGADLNWETEVGNIKDGKRLHMKGITGEYKVGTTERENVFSYSLFGALNLTEDLAVNTKYTSKFSDEYNADMISAGFEYKMDTMGDNGIFGPIFYGIENNKPMSDRWGGTLSLMMETLDDTDRTYYGGGKLNGGDYATSTIYKPKFTLSLNDKKSNLGYYFEGYYQNNKMLQGMKSNEAKMHASRIHGEVRWTDTYSKGKYGINIGYRHEESDKPQNFNQTYYRRTERKVHQLRLTPNFTYELGNGFTFTGKTTGIFEYNYAGDRESQMDFLMENEYGIVYTGFMPNWRLSLIYFRDDRWYDNSNRKVSWDSKKKEYFYDYNTSGRYQLGQIRPTVIYYFGNGGSFKFDTRIPLGNGQWYDDKKGNKSSGEAYEVRYGFNYYHPVTPGLTMNVGGTFLNIKNKAATGDITRSYSFRPNIGFSYSF